MKILSSWKLFLLLIFTSWVSSGARITSRSHNDRTRQTHQRRSREIVIEQDETSNPVDVEEFRNVLLNRKRKSIAYSINNAVEMMATDDDSSSSFSCISDDDLKYVKGRLSFQKAFEACLDNIADVTLLPTLVNGTLTGPMSVTTSLQLNNLHVVSTFLIVF